MSLRTFLRNLPPGQVATIAGVGWHSGTEAAASDAGWPMGVVRDPKGDLLVVDYHGQRIWRIDGEGILHPFAGDGVQGFAGDGGRASDARFDSPHDLWRDREGNLYLSDLGNHRIRRIDGATGVITTVAGCGVRGREGDGGPATEAQLDISSGVAKDSQGNLYIADEPSSTVRKVDTQGIIRRYAGIGVGGFNGDGIPALEAALYHCEHLAVDSRDNLYICDNSNDRIRKVDRRGILTTVLGNPYPVGVDCGSLRSSIGDGGPAVDACIIMPDAIFIDARDNLYVAEKYGFRVRRVDAATGIVRTVVGTGVPGFGDDGDVGPKSQINSCECGLWADPDGTTFWSDCSGRLRKVDGRTGIVSTVLGGVSVRDGGLATNAFITGPNGIAAGSDGTLYFADLWGQRIRAIDLETWQIRTVAGNGVRFYGGDGGAAVEAYLGNPHDVAQGPDGEIYIADTRYNRIRRVDPAGSIATHVGTGMSYDSGDGGPSVSAAVTAPLAVTASPRGEVYLGDSVGRIRRVDPDTGVITTVAGTGRPGFGGDGGPAREASISGPSALTLDREGNLYFADTGNHAVRCVDVNGRMRTVVGTGRPGRAREGARADEAPLDSPRGVAVDGDGNLYISDTGNHRVLVSTRERGVRVLAGTGEGGESGDGGLATRYRLNHPTGLALLEGCLLVSDHYNNRIRAIKLP